MTLYTSDCTPLVWALETGAGVKGTVINNSSSVYYGQSISDVQYYLKQHGTVGIVSAQLFQCSDGSVKHTFWTMNLSDVSPTGAWTANTSIPYTGTIVVGDIIGVSWSVNCGVSRVNSNCIDGTNSGYASSATDCTADHGFDMWYKITTGGAPSSGTTFFPPRPAYVRL